jgi:hypothetical protein
VFALAAALTATGANAAEDEAAWLYDPGAVVEIDLGLSPEELDALEAEPDEYQPGSFLLKVDGEAVGPPLGDVGIRLKGGLGSFRPLTEKAAFKVKFNAYSSQTFYGLKKMTLNNMVQDPSMVHETLSYELFRSLGVVAPRTGFAFVAVNEDPYGVYLNVETLDKISLARWFASTRHLYEADTPGLDVALGKSGFFEVDEGKSSNREDLDALITAANDEEGDWSDGMATVADLAEMTRMWAVERYVGHWDGYAGMYADLYRPNNYYLHSEDAGVNAGKFRMLPWGTDQTWGQKLEFDEEAGGLLFDNCLADESCAALYVDALREVQAALAPLDPDSSAGEISTLLAPWQALDPRLEYSLTEVDDSVDATREFIADRPEELAEWLRALTASPQPPESPAAAAQEASVPPLSSEAPALRIGTPRADGAVVITEVLVPGPGRVVQEVSARFDGRRQKVCAGRVLSHGAGTVSVRCRFSKAARHRLASAPLRTLVRVGYAASGADLRFLAQGLTVTGR